MSYSGNYGQLRSPNCPSTDEIRDEGSPPPGPPSGFLNLQRSPYHQHLKDGKLLFIHPGLLLMSTYCSH